MSIPTVTLVSGTKVPSLAFGIGTALYKSDCTPQVTTALEAGFTHLDHAEVYANSAASGKAISAWLGAGKAKREDLYILTKLFKAGIADPMQETKREIELLQCDGYVDAVLLHYPPRGKDGEMSNVEAWKALEKVKDAGLARVIGVSNWLAEDIEEVVKSNPKHKIEINQIELNPYLVHHHTYQDLLAIHKRENIKAMSYGVLTSQYKDAENSAALNKYLTDLSAKRGEDESASSLLQAWAIARTGGIVVTTTSKKERAKEYVSFAKKDVKLSAKEVEELEETTKESAEALKKRKYYMAPYWKA